VAVSDVLLDTNAYVAFKRGTPDAVDVLTYVARIGINSIVLGELLRGFAVGTHAEAIVGNSSSFWRRSGCLNW
jgi:tRNA(fMet)-specific endonuclease VapC